IRDFHVTGVQTCALPIFSYPRAPLAKIAVLLALFGALIEVMQAIPTFHRDAELADWLVDIGAIVAVIVLVAIQRVGGRPAGQGQIGRASCRARGRARAGV